MTRLQAFEQYATHPWLKKAYGKLKKPELDLARQFLNENSGLDCDLFVEKVQRMFLNVEPKPKNWTIINELLVCAATSLRPAQPPRRRPLRG